MKLSTAHKIGRFFQYFVLILVGVIMIYPLVWMVGATFKSNAEIFSGIGFLTGSWTLEAWIKGDDNSWKDLEVIFGGGEYSLTNRADYLPLVIEKGRLHSTWGSPDDPCG